MSFRPEPKNLRDPVSNQPYLKRLFIEGYYGVNDIDGIAYTLKDQDHELHGKLFVSLYRLYTEKDDPTEIHFAQTYLSGYDHWIRLCECTWFKPYIERWREEVSLKRRARYLKEIEAIAGEEGKFKLAALKILLTETKPEKEKSTRGRPSKLEVQKELKKAAEDLQDAETDYERIIRGAE